MVYILIALAVFLLDSFMKNYVEDNIRIGEKKDILKGKITLKREYNSGFCLNVLDCQTANYNRVQQQIKIPSDTYQTARSCL